MSLEEQPDNNEAITVPTDKDATIVPKVKKSLLQFDLPPVTEQSTGYIDDDPIDNVSPDSGHETESIESPIGDSENAEKMRGALDDKGHAYDPAIHTYPPEKTGKLGKWKRKPKGQQGESGEVKSEAAYQLAAQRYAELYGNTHVTIWGHEAGIETPEHLKPLCDSIKSYLEAEGYSEINPKLAIGLSAFNYTMSILQRPTVWEQLTKQMTPVVKWVKSTLGIKTKPKTDEEE